jgi:hypothetical protein
VIHRCEACVAGLHSADKLLTRFGRAFAVPGRDRQRLGRRRRGAAAVSPRPAAAFVLRGTPAADWRGGVQRFATSLPFRGRLSPRLPDPGRGSGCSSVVSSAGRSVFTAHRPARDAVVAWRGPSRALKSAPASPRRSKSRPNRRRDTCRRSAALRDEDKAARARIHLRLAAADLAWRDLARQSGCSHRRPPAIFARSLTRAGRRHATPAIIWPGSSLDLRSAHRDRGRLCSKSLRELLAAVDIERRAMPPLGAT